MTNRHYAIAGLAAPVLFWPTYFIMANGRPEYSFLTKAISELGSLDAPNKWVWNILGYILPGALISVFSIGLYRAVAVRKSSKLPLVGIALSGAFMALSGVFPGDFDDRQSATMLLHTVGSLGCFIFFLLGAFSYPKLMRANPDWKKVATPSLVITWLAIVFGAWPFLFPEFPAVGQRLVFLFYFAWIAYTAIRLHSLPQTAGTARPK